MRDDASYHRLVVLFLLFFGLACLNIENVKLAENGVLAKNFVAALKECLFGTQDVLFGEEWLVRVCSRTDGVTATTLGTGITV